MALASDNLRLQDILTDASQSSAGAVVLDGRLKVAKDHDGHANLQAQHVRGQGGPVVVVEALRAVLLSIRRVLGLIRAQPHLYVPSQSVKTEVVHLGDVLVSHRENCALSKVVFSGKGIAEVGIDGINKRCVLFSIISCFHGARPFFGPSGRGSLWRCQCRGHLSRNPLPLAGLHP